MDGFLANSGVNKQSRRENPEGQQMLPSAGLAVPTNVPFVTPQPVGETAAPDQGALGLARALGNIDFGAIGRTVKAKKEVRDKLKEEAEQSKGYADTSELLSKTGKDYAALVSSGALPASASPSFQLGSGIAAAQAELARLRVQIAERRIKAPDAGIFTEDADFMAPFYQRLNGVRDEAKVKYFLQPLQELVADDAKGFVAAGDKKLQEKFKSDAIGTFADGLKNGDPFSGAFNNAVNVLKLGNMKTQENVKEIIKAAGPRIVEQATDAKGRVDLARAAQLIQDVGRTKVASEGDRQLSILYTDAYEELSNYVFGTVHRRASADKAMDEARQDEAQGAYIKYLGGSFNKVSALSAVGQGVKLGLDANTALSLYNAWDHTAGNVSKTETLETKQEANRRMEYSGLTEREAKEEVAYLNDARKSGHMADSEYLSRMKILESVRDENKRAPISASDQSLITKTVGNQIPTLFPGMLEMRGHFMGAARKYGLGPNQWGKVQDKVADSLGRVAMTWIMQSPRWSEYLSAVDNIQTDQAGPGRVLRSLTEEFMTTNRSALGTMVRQALGSDNPDAALGSMKITNKGASMRPATRVYEARPAARPQQRPTSTERGGSRFPNLQKLQQEATRSRSSGAPPANQFYRTPSPNAGRSGGPLAGMGNIMDPKSPIFGWYKTNVRAKHPNMDDAAVRNRIQNMHPETIFKLQQLYKRERGL